MTSKVQLFINLLKKILGATYSMADFINLTVLLTFLLTLVGCDPPQEMLAAYQPDKESLVNAAMIKTYKELHHYHELYACGLGGCMMYKIQRLNLSFFYYQEVDLEKGRELIVAAGETLIKNVNEEKLIHQYLQDDPFGPKNAFLYIFLQKPNGSEPEMGELTVISLSDGIIYYEVRAPDPIRFKTIHRETFKEAVEKLKAAKFYESDSSTIPPVDSRNAS